MQPSTSQTITVRFGPDSAVSIAVHVTDAVDDVPSADSTGGSGMLDVRAGAALMRRALAIPAVASQLNALVSRETPCDPSEDAAGHLPRYLGGRVHQW